MITITFAMMMHLTRTLTLSLMLELMLTLRLELSLGKHTTSCRLLLVPKSWAFQRHPQLSVAMPSQLS